jgi:hypothetical protein
VLIFFHLIPGLKVIYLSSLQFDKILCFSIHFSINKCLRYFHFNLNDFLCISSKERLVIMKSLRLFLSDMDILSLSFPKGNFVKCSILTEEYTWPSCMLGKHCYVLHHQFLSTCNKSSFFLLAYNIAETSTDNLIFSFVYDMLFSSCCFQHFLCLRVDLFGLILFWDF